jgi:hypothetical protein
MPEQISDAGPVNGYDHAFPWSQFDSVIGELDAEAASHLVVRPLHQHFDVGFRHFLGLVCHISLLGLAGPPDLQYPPLNLHRPKGSRTPQSGDSLVRPSWPRPDATDPPASPRQSR